MEDRQSPVESTGMAPSEESLPFKHERFIRSTEQGEVQSGSDYDGNGSAAYGDTETRPTPEPFLEEANLAKNEVSIYFPTTEPFIGSFRKNFPSGFTFEN